jgi:beta-xylosidase
MVHLKMLSTKLWATGLLASLLHTAGPAQTTPPAAYRNPVIAGDFADPSVIRVGILFTQPALLPSGRRPIRSTVRTDLVNWQYVGPVFKQMPAWTMGSYWAP